MSLFFVVCMFILQESVVGMEYTTEKSHGKEIQTQLSKWRDDVADNFGKFSLDPTNKTFLISISNILKECKEKRKDGVISDIYICEYEEFLGSVKYAFSVARLIYKLESGNPCKKEDVECLKKWGKYFFKMDLSRYTDNIRK